MGVGSGSGVIEVEMGRLREAIFRYVEDYWGGTSAMRHGPEAAECNVMPFKFIAMRFTTRFRRLCPGEELLEWAQGDDRLIWGVTKRGGHTVAPKEHVERICQGNSGMLLDMLSESSEPPRRRRNPDGRMKV